MKSHHHWEALDSGCGVGAQQGAVPEGAEHGRVLAARLDIPANVLALADEVIE